MRTEGPTYAQLSRRISELYYDREKAWAGVPMAIPGLRLALEDRSPWRETVDAMEAIIHERMPPPDPQELTIDAEDVRDDDDLSRWTVRNAWYSSRLGRDIVIVTDGTRTRPAFGRHAATRRVAFAIHTAMASTAWTMETEIAAMERLQVLIKPHLFESYVTTGTFIETSRRSGNKYLFRRCRPTLVISRDGRAFCTLCLHPLAYYQDSHAGGLCPTDDVIAHLMLMRADEPFLWRRANQHPIDRPESGV